MSKLTNHSSITGVTDCVHQTGGLLIGSCYDLANGESALNGEFSLDCCVIWEIKITTLTFVRFICFQYSLCLSVVIWPLWPGLNLPEYFALHHGPLGAETTGGSLEVVILWYGSSYPVLESKSRHACDSWPLICIFSVCFGQLHGQLYSLARINLRYQWNWQDLMDILLEN